MDDLGDLQRAVMDVLWAHGEQTVQQVRERLSAELAYTTVLSVMQKLERLKWVSHKEQGRAYVYRAVRTRGQESSTSLQTFIDRVFGGDRIAAFQHLLDGRALSDEELADLGRLVNQKRRERKHGE
jgi:predicted transcriptional regulator